LPKDAPDELVARIVGGAEGHPFVIAQLAESAASGNLEAVPATVFDVLRLRLEALTPLQRRVLRGASVYGERFWHAGLVALLEPITSAEIGDALDAITRDAIIRASESATLGGEREFAFRHALLRDASYESIPESERVAAHAAAGLWLEQAGERDAMVLARHFEHGAVHTRAAQYLRRAAEASLAASDMAAAYDRASRALAHATPSDRGPLEHVCAEASYYTGELQRAAECARRATELLPLGTRAWFQAAGWAVTSSGQRGDNDEVERWAALVAEAESSADARSAHAICLSRILTQLVAAGRMKEVPRCLARARELTHSVATSDPQAVEWIERVNAAVCLRASDFAGALDAAIRAATAAQICADERGLCFARIVGATGHLLLGDFESAEQSVRQGLALAERLGVEYLRHWGSFSLGKVYAQRGDLPRAQEILEAAIRGVATSPRIAGSALVYLARAAHLAGDFARAAETADRAIAMKTASSLRASALATRARADVALGRRDDALAHANAAMSILRELGAIEETETLVRLAYAEALSASESPEAGVAVRDAKARILRIAATMNDARRDSFLTRVPENVATLALEERRG
jgi:tetratricopeptide (TPR) repeat protein